MPGAPLNPYLADVFAAWNSPTPDPFAPGAQLAGYGPPSATPVVSGTPLAPVAPPPNATGFPSLANVPPAPPPPAPAGPPAPPPEPGMTSAYEDPNALVSRAPPAMSQAPVAPPVGVEPGPAPPPPPQPGPDPHAFDLVPTMGGGSPAHEVDLRGPTLRNAQDVRQDTYASTIGAVGERNARAADTEYQMAVSQERAARLREAAYQQSLAEQDEELQARQDDFDQTARQLSRLGQIDHGRFWASRSTGQKIAGALEVMLSGFTGGQSMIQKRIDDDIKAQEFAYMAGRDAVNAKQSAFSAAMQKYQNANAARLAARVASQDVVAAQLGQIAALNKGNETGNRALEALAQLSNDRMLMIQQGIKFMPAQSGGRYWQDPNTGLIYNETEAKALRAKQVEYGQQERIEGGKVGGQLLLQRDKAALEDGDGSGMTREQRGKLQMEHGEASRAAEEFNSQVDSLINHPVLDRLGVVTAAKAKLPGSQRVAPEAAAAEQDLEKINTQTLQAVGKVAKDADGKPNIAMIERLEKRFSIHLGDTKQMAIQKLEGAREVVNALARQQGATNAPAPNMPVRPNELPSSAKVYKK